MTTTSPPAPDASAGQEAPGPTARPRFFRHARDRGPLLPGTHVRLHALDGLRAVAVVLVVIYHVAPSWMPAGFLGVSLFFTLSGFLITRLLLGEHHTTGHVALRTFWGRRFRRLLPAALLTLVVVTVGWFVAGWLTPAIGGDVVASLAEVANWRFLITGTAYGAQTDASPVLHFWSLAIEEQFYLVYPLLVWLVVRRTDRPVRALGVVVTVLLVASVAYTLTQSGRPLTVYFSTFSRAAEVLLGALLAVLTWQLARPLNRWVLGVAGAVAASVLVVVSATSELTDPVWAHGGLAAVGVLSTLAVIGATQPGPFARFLGARPLVRIGELSYGIYLFHWPILLALRSTDLSDLAIAAITVVASVVLADVSIRFLENPIRAGGWRGPRPLLMAAPVMATIVVLAIWGGARSDTPTFDFRGERGIEDMAVTLPPPTDEAGPDADTDATTEVPTGPVTVSLFGDSTAWQLRLAMTDADPRFEVRPGWNDIACTLTRGGPFRGDYDTDVGFESSTERCDWTDTWPATVQAAGSEMAIVYGGTWDTLPRLNPTQWDGWKTVEDPEVAAHVRSEMVALTDALHGAGADHVVWLTLAPNIERNAELNLRRVDIFNQLLSEAAEQRPEVLTVVDMGGWFATQPDELRPDGVHVTEETGRQVLETWLADQLLAAAGR